MYLTGNPCTDWPRWKEYLCARLDTIGRIDGDEITKSQRMKAKQNLKQMEKELTVAARKSIAKKLFEEKEGTYKPNGYTKEFRRECYLEKKYGDEKRAKQQKEGSIFKEYNEFYDKTEEGPPEVYNKKGEVRQLNQGKYEWRFDESPDKTCILFEIRVPKFMDTQHINVDL